MNIHAFGSFSFYAMSASDSSRKCFHRVLYVESNDMNRLHRALRCIWLLTLIPISTLLTSCFMIAACSSPIKGKPKLNEASETSKDPVNLAALDSMMPGTYFATKALVQASYPIREYSSSKGQGKVLTVLIGDETSLFLSIHRQCKIDSNWYFRMEITNNGKKCLLKPSWIYIYTSSRST